MFMVFDFCSVGHGMHDVILIQLTQMAALMREGDPEKARDLIRPDGVIVPSTQVAVLRRIGDVEKTRDLLKSDGFVASSTQVAGRG